MTTALPDAVTIVEFRPRYGLQNEPGVVPTEVKVGFIDRPAATGLPVVDTTASMADQLGRPPVSRVAQAILAKCDDRPDDPFTC